MELEKKNMKRIMIFLGALIFALVLRLAYIQLIGGGELAAATRAQSLISLEGSNTRGIIYDRNGAALVADQKHFVYIIKEADFDEKAAKLLEQASAREVSSDNKGYYVYSSQDYDKKIGRTLIQQYNAYILQASSRYGENQLAPHLIGYVNRQDASGAAGLELMYDKQLSGLNRRIYAVADVKGNILPGRGLIIASDDEKDSYVKEGIRTTVDKDLQNAVEGIIGESGEDCAVVVLDSRSGGVAAMACTPDFDPNNINAYMESEGNELMNKATQGEYAPGSVFKIVVTAAALEEGVDLNQSFFCNGRVQAGNLSIGCETGGEEGHGEITLTDAFAQSCNSYFVQLGQEIGADAIIETAEAMGLAKNALDGYPQAGKGHLMTEQERYGDAIGNLSIGQGQTLVTPLQIAAMTNVIANGGNDPGVHLLMEEEDGQRQVLSQQTASQIGDMMALVCEEGTAKSLGLMGADGKPRAAVKTGTAEYGAKEDGRTHGWITGYTPCEEPEYTITVLVEGGASGAGSAGPIFQKILEYLEDSGSYSMPTLA